MATCILLSLIVLGSIRLATRLLSQPMGLAVDAKGNPYVANWAVNQILIYNPTYQCSPANAGDCLTSPRVLGDNPVSGQQIFDDRSTS